MAIIKVMISFCKGAGQQKSNVLSLQTLDTR